MCKIMNCRENSRFLKTFHVLRFVKCHFIIFLTLTMFAVLCRIIKDSNSINQNSTDIPIVLWWTPFTGSDENVRLCSQGQCLFTENRKHVKKLNTPKVILFYGSDFKIEDLPLPRTNEWWGLLHEESPKNQPLFDHLNVLKLFNITSTFKYNSAMPLTLQYLQGFDALISSKYYKLTTVKSGIQRDGFAPIIYLQSECNPPSQRDEFVKELSRHIPIDSYGTCLKNKVLPAHLQGIESMNSDEILELISKYKFSLALENAACDDYITEKLWRPLNVGTVPIYWGAANVERWLPNENSIINVRNYESTRDLADYLQKLLKNDTAYESYLDHKIYNTVANKKLTEELKKRQWGINEEQETKGTFVESFECFACDSIIKYKNSIAGTIMAGLKDYGCPPPETIIHEAKTKDNFWIEQWHKAKIEADVLSDLITRSPGAFTMEHFYSRVLNILNQEGSYFKKFSLNEEL